MIAIISWLAASCIVVFLGWLHESQTVMGIGGGMLLMLTLVPC